MFVSCLSLGKVQKVALLDHPALPRILHVKEDTLLYRHVSGDDGDFKLLFF